MNLQREIQQQDASRLHPSQNESLLAQGLIAQYLAHDGFIETAKAFSEEVRNGSRLLTGVDKAPRELDYKEDLDAINRQSISRPSPPLRAHLANNNPLEIRTSILDGNVDKALKLTNAFYPAVLAENENIYFKLRCRKFIEMIRRSTELQVSSAGRGVQRRSSSSVGKMATNGHHDGSAGDDGVFDGADMELDDAPADEMAVEAGADGMDIEESDLHSRQNDLTGEALRYGQELQSEFKDDPRREVKQALEDTFALIAYPDARESSLAPLLETAGRIPVAEELNSAILGKLYPWPHQTTEPPPLTARRSVARQVLARRTGTPVPAERGADHGAGPVGRGRRRPHQRAARLSAAVGGCECGLEQRAGRSVACRPTRTCPIPPIRT